MTLLARIEPATRGRLTTGLGAALAVVVGGVGLGLAAGVATAPAAGAADAKCEVGSPQSVAQSPPALARLGAESAWGLSKGSGVVVAVVDSGVDPGNAHLPPAALLPGIDLVGTAGSPDGHTDATGHGTALAGQIAARYVPGSGVIGLAKNAKILPVRVFYTDDDGAESSLRPNTARIAAGIDYAVASGAKIINVSASSPTPDPVLEQAVHAATAARVLVVASAGNRLTAEDTTDSPRYPAAYPEVLSVTAVDDQDKVTEDSIHGAHVDVAAPGTNVLTAFHAAGDCMLGAEASTSFATAYASAAAALVASRFATESPAQWAYRLEATASRQSAGTRDNLSGWGVIRPYEALAFVDDGSAPGPPSPVHRAPVGSAEPPQALHLGARVDPLAATRAVASWWVLAGGVALVGALLASRLTARRRRRS